MRHLDHLQQVDHPLAVGALSDPAVLGAAVSPAECDLIELRLDALGTGEVVREFCRRQAGALPILLTARHPQEGGVNDLSASRRTEAIETLLDAAAAIDVEIRSLSELESVWSEAGSRGLVRVASFHDFGGTPGIGVLAARVDAAAAAGATVAKLAFRLDGPRDLETLLALFEKPSPIPLSVMGMGPLAPSSRLLAAQLGSILNYGYLGSNPTAPGQWPARLLKEALAQSPHSSRRPPSGS